MRRPFLFENLRAGIGYKKMIKVFFKSTDNRSRSSLKSDTTKGGVGRLEMISPLNQARMPKNKGVYYGFNTCRHKC